MSIVLGAGGQLGARVLAERRGDKYLPDVFSAGANTIHDVLYKAQEPIKPAHLTPIFKVVKEVLPRNELDANVAAG